MKKVLIAIDDGPASEKIASKGFQLGRRLNAEIALVSIIDNKALITEGGITPGELVHTIKNDYKKSHQLLIDNIFKDYKIWTFIEEGKPFEAILKVGKEWEADIIAIGTHGRTGLSHLLMGSVAEKLIKYSVKPLFIIPTKL